MANRKKQLFEDCDKITIQNLKRYGYFDGGTVKGVYDLKRELIDIELTTGEKGRERLRIKNTNGATMQTIELIRKPSNLKRGYFYLFICPEVKKPCYKLYRSKGNELFLSYRAYTDLVYQKQTLCPKLRPVFKLYEFNKQIEHLENELFKPKKKSHYKGEPTPTLKRLIAMQTKATDLLEQPFFDYE